MITIKLLNKMKGELSLKQKIMHGLTPETGFGVMIYVLMSLLIFSLICLLLSHLAIQVKLAIIDFLPDFVTDKNELLEFVCGMIMIVLYFYIFYIKALNIFEEIKESSIQFIERIESKLTKNEYKELLNYIKTNKIENLEVFDFLNCYKKDLKGKYGQAHEDCFDNNKEFKQIRKVIENKNDLIINNIFLAKLRDKVKVRDQLNNIFKLSKRKSNTYGEQSNFEVGLVIIPLTCFLISLGYWLYRGVENLYYPLFLVLSIIIMIFYLLKQILAFLNKKENYQRETVEEFLIRIKSSLKFNEFQALYNLVENGNFKNEKIIDFLNFCYGALYFERKEWMNGCLNRNYNG